PSLQPLPPLPLPPPPPPPLLPLPWHLACERRAVIPAAAALPAVVAASIIPPGVAATLLAATVKAPALGSSGRYAAAVWSREEAGKVGVKGGGSGDGGFSDGAEDGLALDYAEFVEFLCRCAAWERDTGTRRFESRDSGARANSSSRGVCNPERRRGSTSTAGAAGDR
ncbi:unnamed protein product, partial [Phaeothamnion confervicola]